MNVRDSHINQLERYEPGEHGPEGTIKVADFTLAGHHLKRTDSWVKHNFTFTPSTSIFVDCIDEAELETAFKQLSEGGGVLMPLGNYGFSRSFGWVTTIPVDSDNVMTILASFLRLCVFA